jgi:hypothetical protein
MPVIVYLLGRTGFLWKHVVEILLLSADNIEDKKKYQRHTQDNGNKMQKAPDDVINHVGLR